MPNKKRETKAQISAKIHKQYTIWSIGLFAIGVLITLMSILSFGIIGEVFRTLLLGVFGLLAYLVGPFIIYTSVFISRTRDMGIIIPKIARYISLFLVFSAMIQILTAETLLYDNWIEKMVRVYEMGTFKKGAGAVGFISSFVFEFFFGKIGALVVLSIILFVLIMVYTGTTLQEFLNRFKGPAEAMGGMAKNAYQTSRDKMIEKEEGKKQGQQNDEDNLPEHPVQNNFRTVAKHKNKPMNIDIEIGGNTGVINVENHPKNINEKDFFNAVKETNEIQKDVLDGVKINVEHIGDEDKPIKNCDDGVGTYLDGVINKAIVKSVEETNFRNYDDDVSNIEKDIKNEVEKSIIEINNIKFNNNDYIEKNIEDGHIEPSTIDDILKNVNTTPDYNGIEETEVIGFNIQNDETTMFDTNTGGIDEESEKIDFTIKNYKESEENDNADVDNIAFSIKEAKNIKVRIANENSTSLKDDKTIYEEVKEYDYPSINLLEDVKITGFDNNNEELRNNADKLLETLRSFGVKAKLLEISRGPSVTRYELQPDVGVKISKITGLSDDIALSLASSGIRIEAPIPNKSAIGIEVPNKNVDMVQIKEIIDSKEFRSAESKLSVALGKDITGNVIIADLAKMPHLLVAGATGSGKSVCINTMISSLLFKSSPEEVKLLMIDPKVVELGIYNGIPHLLIPVVTDPKKAAGALGWAVSEMLKRYQLFAEFNVRDLKSYNKLANRTQDMNKLPQIVIIIDELADLMMASPRDVEDAICRLAQMARAAGMHLIIATQRPSVDVITGIIKANIPSRIAFSVSSQVDSRTILDSSGAEKLLGRGDMLFYPVGTSKPTRVQGCFVDDSEIERLVDYIKQSTLTDYDEDVIDEIEKQAQSKETKQGNTSSGDMSYSDPMVDKAIQTAVELGQISTSMLQRKLRLGYARAARIVDELEEMGIVGPAQGSKARQVLISKDQWIEMNLNKNN